MTISVNGSGGGTTLTVGHAWERPSPVAAGAGNRFLDVDSMVTYTSSGASSPGWAVELGTQLGPDRVGLRLNGGIVYQGGVDLSGYTLGNCTLATLISWEGPMGAAYSSIATLGEPNAALTGFHVYFKQAGGDIQLVVMSNGGGAGEVLLTTFVAGVNPLTVGLHALAIAPVSVAGVDTWRWSFDGSAVAETAMVMPYVAPDTSDGIGMGCRPAGDLPLFGVVHDLIVWGSTLSGTNLVALASLPGTPTYRLAPSASTGAPAIRVEANRYDLLTPLSLLARGLPLPMTVGAAVRKVQYA